MVEKMLQGAALEREIGRETTGVVAAQNMVAGVLQNLTARGLQPGLSKADVQAVVAVAKEQPGTAQQAKGIGAYVTVRNSDGNDPKFLSPVRDIKGADIAPAMETFSTILEGGKKGMDPQEMAKMLTALAVSGDAFRANALGHLDGIGQEKRDDVIESIRGIAGRRGLLTGPEMERINKFLAAQEKYTYND